MSDPIYKHAERYVTELFDKTPHPNLVYHNLEHTKTVVKRAQEIAHHYLLGERESIIVTLAAWFHDTGHLVSGPVGHEQKGVELMKEFMLRESDNEADIQEIAGCIMATQLPTEPTTKLQEIICDADTYHFGTKDFRKTNKQVKKELLLRNSNTLLLEWEKNSLEMLEKHEFYTTYCQVLLDEGKRKNIERMREKYLERVNAAGKEHLSLGAAHNSKEEKQAGSMVPRGIQTMIRLVSSNHLHLSEMADRKAHILISVNSIIISIILTVFIKRSEGDVTGMVPALVFLCANLITIILAIMATRPKVTEGKFLKEDVLNRKTNLLFFGNFYKASLEEYQWAMSILMNDQEYLYGVLFQDIHQLAVVLGRKYKLIRLAYDVFMVGLLITVITFLVAFWVHNSQSVPGTTITNTSGSPL